MLDLPLEKQFARQAFVSAIDGASPNLVRESALRLFDLLQLQHVMVSTLLKRELSGELPAIAPDPTAVSLVVEMPQEYYDRLVKFVEANPHLSQQDVWLNALVLYLER